MSGNYDSWEDAAAQDEDLNRQAQNMNINAGSFRPGASSFQPGVNTFQPGQQFNGYQQQYNGYGQQQGYNQYQQYPQGQQQQSFGQYQQYQQQQQQPPPAPRQNNNSQFAAYNQAPGQFQPKQGAPISIAKRGGADTAAAPAETKPKPTPVPTAKADATPAKAKVLSIGVPALPKASDKKTASPTTSTAPSEDKVPNGQETPAEAGAKIKAAKAVEKSGETTSGKTTPPSKTGGKSSPTPAEISRKKADADAVAAAQTADVSAAVLEEMYGKEHVNVIFIGHVDAGKSTLGGQILIQTGMVDERTLDKYKKEAKDAGKETWYISWVLDLNTEERAKGKTIEVGRGFFETEARRYTILDAPGHKTYVPNMLSGAAQADVAILVISARKGEFETGFEKGGQTQEHAMLIKTTGAKEVVVAVNKMDDVTVEWAQERYKEIEGKLKPFLKKKMGLDSTFIPISAQTGLGVKERIPKKIAPWANYPSLLEFLDDMKTIVRNTNAPFMMPVGAKYRDLGTMIEGRIEAGVVQKSTSSLIMMPNKESVSISALYGETEEEIPHATCGEQIRMRIRGIEEEDIMPGFVLCSPRRLVHCVSAFEAQINIVDLRSILSAGFNCVCHVHSATEEVTFEALLHKLEPKTGRKSKKPPPFASKGMAIIARLRVTSGGEKICVERFEDYPQLGRFTLRDQGQTIAVGKITKLILDE